MDFKDIEAQYDKIKDMYLNQNISSTKIAEIIGCKRYQINYLLKKYNISKSFSEARREYYLNEHYFDEIDTPNKAYILGFLYADGYNNTINHTICLSLNKKDKDILERMRKEIGCEKPLFHSEYVNKLDGVLREQEILILASKHMSETVEKWGLVKNKTFILHFPDFLREDLYSHFIRGYFDGDGCVCVGKSKTSYTRLFLSFMSSWDFCVGLQKFLENKNITIHVNHPSGKKKENGLARTSDKKEIEKLMHFMYYDADLFLKRKYNIFKSCFNTENFQNLP